MAPAYRPPVVFLVNGAPDSAMGIRARSFARRLEGEFAIHIAHRRSNKVFAIFWFFCFLLRTRPSVCYVLDMAFSAVCAAGLYRTLSRCRVVIDTGDAIYQLSQSAGTRGPIGLWLTRLLEQFSLSMSDRIVVRSHPHQELLAARRITAEVIPDGVDTTQFLPQSVPELRRKYGLEGFTVIGLLGSLIWSPRWNMCYGWDLIEVLGQLRDQPVKGLIIGDGSGLKILKEQCAAYGIEDRILFLGRLPYDELPRYLNLMDICLNTQTNDIPGQVRTTGKLPLYLACGRFVLSSAVGEAVRTLPPEMLVPYHGIKDQDYPDRLAERVRDILKDSSCLNRHESSVQIALANFDYDVLATTLRGTIDGVLPSPPGARPRGSR